MRECEDLKAPRTSRWLKIGPLAVGMIAALLTLGLYDFGSSSLGKAGQVLAGAAFPGLLGAAAIAGNVHAFNLWVAAGFNGIFYCGIAWAALSLVSVIVRRFR
jgi:hypothetical protein